MTTKVLTYGSLFSGVEAASLAVAGLDFRPRWFAEIEPFCCALLKHRYPRVPNLGDVSKIKGRRIAAVDVLFAGAPCQAFSCAGQRGGIDDPRGNLTLEWLRLVGEVRPRWFVFENVPGLLTVDGGKTFGLLLAALSQLGYGVAWRVLDARHFGVAQRRRRVYLVGRFGGSIAPAGAVLFESAGVSGSVGAGGASRQGVATRVGRGAQRGGRSCAVAFSHRGDAGDAVVEGTPTLLSQPTDSKTGRRGGHNGTAVLAFKEGAGGKAGGKAGGIGVASEVAPTIGSATSGNQRAPAVLAMNNDSRGSSDDHAYALRSGQRAQQMVADGFSLRRLTPRECERLMGFPDDWTRIPWRGKPAEACPDAPRYRVIGNSFVVPVVRWIAARIAQVERERAPKRRRG